MAYDERLAERVRARIGDVDATTELQMFGGWGVTIHGNMAVGVLGEDLIVRVGPDEYARALQRRGARPFDFTGRAMTGWVFVEGTSVRRSDTLGRWVDLGVRFARSLPAKHSRGPRGSRAGAARATSRRRA
jgi:TfoX/Sxy family transcriptional regulator of competence genes